MKTSRMKKSLYAVCLFACGMVGSVFGELLIFKQGEGSNPVALDDSDKHSYYATDVVGKAEKKPESKEEKRARALGAPKIYDILMRYQWPMSISSASSMTADEKAALFGSREDAERIFIERKVKEIDAKYTVVYVPTTLYELFVINWYIDVKNKPNHSEILSALGVTLREHASGTIEVRIDEEIVSMLKVGQKQSYENIVKISDASNSRMRQLHFLINKEFGAYYLKKMSEVSGDSKEPFFSYVAADLIKKITPKMESLLSYIHFEGVVLENGTLNPNSTIGRSLAVEYAARRDNKALLFRGTQEFVHKLLEHELPDDPESKRVNVLESSERVGDLYVFADDELKDVDSSRSKPRSLSLGASLLAGVFNDSTACAYFHFQREQVYGYALYINKAHYIDNNSDRLFTIPALGTLAAIWGRGEWFHARTKIAYQVLPEFVDKIDGLALAGSIYDSTGYILIGGRSPLFHARMLTRYISQNLVLLKTKAPNGRISLGLRVDGDISSDRIVKEEKRIKQALEEVSHAYLMAKPGLAFKYLLETVRMKRANARAKSRVWRKKATVSTLKKAQAAELALGKEQIDAFLKSPSLSSLKQVIAYFQKKLIGGALLHADDFGRFVDVTRVAIEQYLASPADLAFKRMLESFIISGIQAQGDNRINSIDYETLLGEANYNRLNDAISAVMENDQPEHHMFEV